MSKRLHHRHTKRLETVFTSGGVSHRGITSDISDGGLFIRTRYGLVPGSLLDIEIHLPDGKISRMTGRVKRSIRTSITTLKNGMGIELLDKDANYIKLLDLLKPESSNADSTAPGTGAAGAGQLPDYLILACSGCGAKNKVPKAKLSLGPRCGKCRTILSAGDAV